MTPSGLSPEHRRKAINMALQAAVLGYHHRDQIHYTQGPKRWEGIDSHRKAWRGEYPNNADCSAYVTWCLWSGLDHFHEPDIVNRQRWLAGYTGTMLQHGEAIRRPEPGAGVIYGSNNPNDYPSGQVTGEHTAIYTGGGLVVSHGSEPGPLLIPWRYRSDVLSIRRYI